MDDLTGTWFSPAGPKVEVTKVEDGWRYAVFMFRKGSPVGTEVISDPEELREKLDRLEANGYVRQAPGEAPTKTVYDPRGVILLGLGILAVVILVIVLLA